MTTDEDKKIWDELSGEENEPTNVEHLEIKREPTEKYEALEHKEGINSIILNCCHDGTTRNIFYGAFSGTGVQCSPDEKNVSLILTSGIYTLVGENLKKIHVMIQQGHLSAINTFNANHIKPDDNEPIVYKITLQQLKKKEKKAS